MAEIINYKEEPCTEKVAHPPHSRAPGLRCPGVAKPQTGPLTVGTSWYDNYTPKDQGWEPQTVLKEASDLIYGERQQEYGNAQTNFDDIGHLWEPILGTRPSAEQVALCLLQLKVARAINDTRADRPIKRDTIVDLAGYAGCIEKIQKGV